MSPTVQQPKRTRGRPKGSKDRVARKSALLLSLSNNDETNSSSSTPAPLSKRRASSAAETPQANGFTPVNFSDRSTSRSGRSLSKTPKYAAQASEPESLGPASKKRVSARSTSRVASTETSTRKRLPDHGSQSKLIASPALSVAPPPTPPIGANSYRSLYGQFPYGTPATNNGAINFTQSYLNFNSPNTTDPPINTIQPAPGSMAAPRKSLLSRTAIPEVRAPAPAVPVTSRPISEVLDAYQGLYNTVHKQYKAFEAKTWNIPIRDLTRSVFVRVAAMRCRRAQLAYMVKETKNLKKARTEIMEMDRSLVWPPVLEEYPTWYNDLATPALKAELLARIKALRVRITNELGEFERAKILGQVPRREKGTATADEMKWLEIQGQIKEFESMLQRLGDLDVTPPQPGDVHEAMDQKK